jgi:hypothetical protein
MEVTVAILRSHTMTRKLTGLLCLFSFLLVHPLSSTPARADEEVLANYEVIEKISDEAIQELIANMPRFPEGSVVYVEKQRGVGEIDFVLENVLLVAFRNAGIKVARMKVEEREEAEESNSFSLSYQIIRLSLGYSKISRKYWLGSKRVDREAQIDLFAQLAETGSGEIIWVGESQKRHEDVIDYSLLEKVEDPEYAFTQPERKELRLSKLIEPLVVGGVVVGLVFLFFSNQSNE